MALSFRLPVAAAHSSSESSLPLSSSQKTKAIRQPHSRAAVACEKSREVVNIDPAFLSADPNSVAHGAAVFKPEANRPRTMLHAGELFRLFTDSGRETVDRSLSKLGHVVRLSNLRLKTGDLSVLFSGNDL